MGEVLEQIQSSRSVAGPGNGHDLARWAGRRNLRSENRDELGVFRFANTEQDGVYRAVVGANPRDWLWAVNVPTATGFAESSESDPARTNESELKGSVR